MDSSDEPQSLRALFEAAEAKRLELDEAPNALAPGYGEKVAAALKLYGQVIDQIGAVSLFSTNEGIEDVATTALPYMLADFYLAELVQRAPHLAAAQRKLVLARARAAYERFLALLDGYGLVKAPYDRMLERYRDDEESFAVVTGGDATARRDAKIASYKAEKQLRGRLELLRRDPRYLDNGDEEVVRELYLADILFSTHATFQALDSINRELPILALAPSEPPSTMVRSTSSAQDENDTTLRLDQPMNRLRPGAGGGPLLSRQGQPLQPFTLVGSRADLARGVFRPGHNLPTMSIDEYLDEEHRRGNVLQGGAEPPKPPVDEDDMEIADRETYKARDWDEFKDDNPKGAGNTLNMG